jgi:hypothetical protein
MQARYDALVPPGRAGARRSLAAYERAAAAAAGREARRLGGRVVRVRFGEDDGLAGPVDVSVDVRLDGDSLPAWLGTLRRRAVDSAAARAGFDLDAAPADRRRFRPVALVEGGAAARVVAAAEAQLGWPYVWGGESRAEGGFDCSGLVDYAYAAAGLPLGRPTAAGLQAAALPLPLARALRPGDLVFAGRPAHHVGMVVSDGVVIAAPHRGAVVRLEPLGSGTWDGAGRLGVLGPEPDPRVEVEIATWVPPGVAVLVQEAARRERVPPALLAAQLEAESGFDAAAVSPAGALGMAQFMPETWAGDWNPYRARSPFDPRAAVLAEARYLGRLIARAGGDVPRALAAYDAGWARSARRPWPAETRAYVARIMRRFGGADAVRAWAGGLARGSRPSSGVRLLPLSGRLPRKGDSAPGAQGRSGEGR